MSIASGYRWAARALLAGAVLSSGAFVAVAWFAMQDAARAVNQRLHRGVAATLAERMIVEPWEGSAPPDLSLLFEDLMAINPSLELYLLAPDGAVLSSARGLEPVRVERVDLDAIRQFLAVPDGPPLLGPDPRHPARPAFFSAAALRSEGELRGYLYVIVGGSRFRSVATLESSQRQFFAAWAVLGGLLLACLGFAVVRNRILRRRLAGLRDRMTRFRAGQAGEPGESVRDALDEVEATFGALAERLDSQLEAIEERDLLRRELVAGISHDLRTPLTALQGYLETLSLMDAGLERSERLRYVEAATMHAAHLGERVEELLELARLESPEAIPQIESFSASDLVQDVVQKFQIRAAEGAIRLRAELGRGAKRVRADLHLIERVLENLIDNAIRLTPREGTITVSTVARGSEVAVRVRDTGPGIPERERPRIFERFYRVESGRGGRGLGLGLAIAWRILELHHREIHVESEVGAGSTFWFSLPVEADRSPEGSKSDR